MNTFILWLHLLIITPESPGYESKQVLSHPKQFNTLLECQAAGKIWEENILQDLSTEKYAILYKCVPESAVRAAQKRTENSNWL